MRCCPWGRTLVCCWHEDVDGAFLRHCEAEEEGEKAPHNDAEVARHGEVDRLDYHVAVPCSSVDFQLERWKRLRIDT